MNADVSSAKASEESLQSMGGRGGAGCTPKRREGRWREEREGEGREGESERAREGRSAGSKEEEGWREE